MISVSTTRFQCDGQELMGISTQAPIYKAMKGMKPGDVVTFNGQHLRIDEVL